MSAFLSNVVIKRFYIAFLYNVIMPRKKPDDDELRKRALELRKKGLSYIEIGKQIGRSSYKAWVLVSPYEDHQPKITQVSELNEKIAQLNARLNELTKVTDDIGAQLKRVKAIRDLNERTSRIDEELKGVKEDAKSIKDSINFVLMGATNKTSDTIYGCKGVDKDGFCTLWFYANMEKEWNMRQKEREGKVVYELNVRKHPLVCAACPKFEQKKIIRRAL